MEDLNIRRRIFHSFLNLYKVLKNSTPEKVAYIWQITLLLGNYRCTLTTRRKFTLHKINANFPKVGLTYIQVTRNLRKQCAPNFILREFTAIRAMETLRRKTGEVSYPLGETDQYEDQSKNILNSVLKEELSDTDPEGLIEELWSSRRFCYWNKGAVKQQ